MLRGAGEPRLVRWLGELHAVRTGTGISGWPIPASTKKLLCVGAAPRLVGVWDGRWVGRGDRQPTIGTYMAE